MGKKFSVVALVAALFMASGCTYKLSGTDSMTKLDGTKVDYSRMNKYKTATSCIDYGSRKDESISILEAAQKAGIKNVVYVDISTLDSKQCVIVYGE